MRRALNDHNAEWLDYDGLVLERDGLTFRVRASTHLAVYPIEYTALTVAIEPVDRLSPYYRAWRKELGDDWSIDPLAGDLEIEIEWLLACREAARKEGREVCPPRGASS